MKPAATDYLKIEAALQTRLLKAWRPVANGLYKKIIPLLADEKYGEALTLVHSIDLGPIATKNREYVKAILWKAAEFGAKQAAQSHKTAMSVGSYDTMLNTVANLFVQSFVLNATNQVHASAMQSIARIENARKLAQKADKDTRFVKEFVSFREDGDDMIKTVSSLHTSRLAVWGFTAEAEVRGIAKYMLSAVLDNRTSMYCRFINGRVFEVKGARERIVQTLQATSPDDLKTLAPWPNQSKASMAELEVLSNQDLEARGFNVPPFHPNCRTICVLVEAYTEVLEQHVERNPDLDVEKPQTQEQQTFHKATADAFREAGIKVNEQQVSLWNKLFSGSPVDVLSMLTSNDPLEIIKSKISSAIKFTKDGDVSLKGKTVLGDGTGEMNIVFDPYREQVFLNYAEFQNADPVDASEYMKNLYRRTVDLAQQNGTKQFVVTASGDSGAYAHAMMGFVPTADEWVLLVGEIKQELPDLKLTDKQLQVVEALLDSTSPKAIWALAGLNTKVNGEPLGKVLLKDKKFEATLDLQDQDAMDRLGWYL